MLFTAGLCVAIASAQVQAPWTRAATTVDSWFSGTFALVIGIAICVLGLFTFMFSEGRNKAATVIELIVGGGLVLYHTTMAGGF